MEPMFPNDLGTLNEKAAELIQSSARLSGRLHPMTLTSVMELVRVMNSYYSNQIEGHTTHPLDIERALRKDYSNDAAKRALQLESSAHIEVQHLVESELNLGFVDITNPDFLRRIHKLFYDRLPPEFQVVETKRGKKDRVVPGAVRTCEVEVGSHVAPESNSLPSFLTRFHEAYQAEKLDPLKRIVAIACSHHRLAWIHPFLDGNGRVTRLFSDAYFRVAKVEGYGLWTISRGLARNRDAYMSRLAEADTTRRNDYDGRGNLSERALHSFCDFFLDCALDQVRFMTELFSFETIEERIFEFAERWALKHDLPRTLSRLLSTVFLKGEISRGDAAWLLGVPDRTARRYVSELLTSNILQSNGPAMPLRLAFSTATTAFYMPNLYPPQIEAQATMNLLGS
jgi:Fic family protein